jgi:hypothetical protein
MATGKAQRRRSQRDRACCAAGLRGTRGAGVRRASTRSKEGAPLAHGTRCSPRSLARREEVVPACSRFRVAGSTWGAPVAVCQAVSATGHLAISVTGGPGGRLQQHLSSWRFGDANASLMSCAPAVGSALLAHRGSGLADTIDHYPADATALTDLHDHTIRLRQRRRSHCLRRCGNGQSKPCSCNHPDHFFASLASKAQ